MTQEKLGPENEQCYTMFQGGCYPEVETDVIWEQCKWDFLIKAAAGLLSGLFVAGVLTKPNRITCKRRTWPIILGLGTGIGLASEYCKREMGNALTDKRRRKCRRRRRKHQPWSEPCKLHDQQ